MNTSIVIETRVNAPLAQVWTLFTEPEHIKAWNAAHPSWHSPAATNDLREGGAFSYRMEARDGSAGFDFAGTYTEVRPGQRIAYTIGDGRKVQVDFISEAGGTRIREEFEPEGQNPLELQQAGWQAILDNFGKYSEAYSNRR